MSGSQDGASNERSEPDGCSPSSSSSPSPKSPHNQDQKGESSDHITKTSHVTSTSQTTGSSPIDIKQASCGKFGVFQARLPSPAPSNEIMIDSNGTPVPIDKLIKTANTMSSMMMAHKIALEDDFRLEPGMDISGPLMSLSPIIGSSPPRPAGGPGGRQTSEPSLHSRVKDIIHEAYWDLFKEELDSQSAENEDERKYDISKQLLCDIKVKIIELLLPQHTRLKQDIEDKLDAQIIDQLSRAHSLKLKDYGHYILGVLSKLCAPVRDDKLKELSVTQDVVQMYRGIMELLEFMRLDFANFTLNRFKPHIKAHSQEYERDKFNEILKQQKTIGIDGLEYTRIWLERAVKRVDAIHGIAELVNEIPELQSPMDLGSGPTGTPNLSHTSSAQDSKRDKILRSDVINKILNIAYCELLEWSSKTQKLYPETLLFDEATFKQLAEQYKVLLLTSSVLLTAFAFINRLKLQESNEFKVSIKSHVITLLTASYDGACKPSASHSPIDAVRDREFTSNASTTDEPFDAIKLETVATKLCDDIRQKIEEQTNESLRGQFEQGQQELLRRQILDLQSSTNRVRELARRRILEFVETLLELDVKHSQQKSKMPPPVNIPLGLHCLADEITLTMAQLVKIIRYNRRVFFNHYQEIIIDLASKLI